MKLKMLKVMHFWFKLIFKKMWLKLIFLKLSLYDRIVCQFYATVIIFYTDTWQNIDDKQKYFYSS